MKEDTKYTNVVIGDEVVEFDYWNTEPKRKGIVIGTTEHFALVKFGRWGKGELISKANLEILKS